MSPLWFKFARLRAEDTRLLGNATPQPDLLDGLKGQRVALVGNARALANTKQGAAIDAADVVIRINRAPMPSPESHGRRTDWLALAVRLSAADRARIKPGRNLWMSHKRKRLDWATASSPGFYVHPRADWATLGRKLGSPPTTGAMMIALLAHSRAASIDLYGFDFFSSLSLSGKRTADKVPHDFAAEQAWVQELLARDPRMTLHPME